MVVCALFICRLRPNQAFHTADHSSAATLGPMDKILDRTQNPLQADASFRYLPAIEHNCEMGVIVCFFHLLSTTLHLKRPPRRLISYANL